MCLSNLKLIKLCPLASSYENDLLDHFDINCLSLGK